MVYHVTLIPGDGIGPEVTKAAVRVLEATGIKFVWDSVEAGEQAQQKYGTPVPDSLLASIRKNKLALKGPVTTPVGTGFRSVNVAIRQTLDLYSCLRPIKSFKGAPSRYENIDIIVVRENTEDLYSSIEFEKGSSGAGKISAIVAQELNKKIGDDAGISLKVISEKATRRIVRFAFEYARQYKRKKVTAVHKANILKYSDGLFLEVSKEVAKEYPDVGFDNVIIDNLCMQLVRSPEQYDVLVLPNLYGDIISDLCAGLIGGLGLAPTAN
ncbi:MAG: isocitrate/isopropylmalate family dehydrogenase, partial [Chloroflexi bacterium]|nr:isocitrate/isopropylmalate family dehydrogenase [Chloroflexota bacterium]